MIAISPLQESGREQDCVSLTRLSSGWQCSTIIALAATHQVNQRCNILNFQRPCTLAPLCSSLEACAIKLWLHESRLLEHPAVPLITYSCIMWCNETVRNYMQTQQNGSRCDEYGVLHESGEMVVTTAWSRA